MNILLRQAVFNIMQWPKVYIIAGLLFFTATPLAAQVGPGTAPHSALPPSIQREGLIRSPNPIDRSSNLPVTGNVRGGRYFRGVVPYRAPTYFGETIPSSSLDSFLRDSTGSEDFGRYNQRYKPYYSPTQTVTTITPGYSYVTRPPNAHIGSSIPQTPVFGTSPPRTAVAPDPGAVISLGSSRPMSMTLQELEEQISSEIDAYQQFERPTDLQYQAPVEQFRYDIEQPGEKFSELSKSLTTPGGPLLPSIATKIPSGFPQRVETPTQEEQANEDEESSEMLFAVPWELDEQLDVYEQMKLQLDELQKKIELALATQQDEDTEDVVGPPSGVNRTTIGEGDKIPTEEQTPKSSYAPKPVETDLSVTAEAKRILGSYETFAAFSKDKFNQHMRAAELYLKQGRYYRAADAYTLASIYKPDDPLACAGKSHALFASGEYMSSALFLSRALQIFPEYAQFKIDIEAMIGNGDKLEIRVADVEEWLGRSDAPELHFLLAYVYYQMDKPQRAKEAINVAYEKMPEAPAVLALKKAIEDSI